jgi:hypothetical protein
VAISLPNRQLLSSKQELPRTAKLRISTKSLSVIFRAFLLLISERKHEVGHPARLGKMEIGGGISFS